MTHTHLCHRHLVELPDDPMLPDHITKMRCEWCERRFERDDETGELEPDY